MAYLRKPHSKERQTKKSLKERTKQTKEWLTPMYASSPMQLYPIYLKYCTENSIVPLRYEKFVVLYNEVHPKTEPRKTMLQQRNTALLTAVQKPNADVVEISQQFQVSIRNITRIADKVGVTLPENFPWELAKQNRFTANASNEAVVRQTMNSIGRWYKWHLANATTTKHYASYCLYCAKRKKAKVSYKTFAPAFEKFLEKEPVRQARLAKEKARNIRRRMAE